MPVTFITCSGVDEKTDVVELVRFLQANPRVEALVCVSEKNCFQGSPLFVWLKNLISVLQKKFLPLHLSLRLCSQWGQNFVRGHLPSELSEILSAEYPDGGKIFYRLQPEFSIGCAKRVYVDKIVTLMRKMQDYHFVFPYSLENEMFIREMYGKKVSFDVLYDYEEKINEQIMPALYFDCLCGYKYNLPSSEIGSELDEVIKVNNKNLPFYLEVDACLKDKKGGFSLNRARSYVKAVEKWESRQIW